MRVYVNRRPKQGPWGGGIKTVNKLVEELRLSGHEVVFRLIEGIDVIMCIDPRPNEEGEWYQNFLQYKTFFKNTSIVQRVGDLGTHSKPELTQLVKATLPHSDFLIFPSEWSKEWIGYEGNNCKVIHNCPMSIFHNHKKKDLEIEGEVRLVTHHWSMNPKKGFDIYRELQNYIDKTGKYKFTYIGRKPEEYDFSNYYPPMSALEVAKELPNHDIYITASIEEAGANHVLEAMACGLPVVFHENGGSIVDYCNDYGLKYFHFEEMVKQIDKVVEQYRFYKSKVLSYDKDNSQVVKEYLQIITNL